MIPDSLPSGPAPSCDTFIALSTAPAGHHIPTLVPQDLLHISVFACYVWLVSFTQTEHLALTSHL